SWAARLVMVGGRIALGGAPLATRVVGGFSLVGLLLCILLAWPGRRRWPHWLIAGLCSSVCAALALSLPPSTVWVIASVRLATLALATGFLATAAVRDLRDPLR